MLFQSLVFRPSSPSISVRFGYFRLLFVVLSSNNSGETFFNTLVTSILTKTERIDSQLFTPIIQFSSNSKKLKLQKVSSIFRKLNCKVSCGPVFVYSMNYQFSVYLKVVNPLSNLGFLAKI